MYILNIREESFGGTLLDIENGKRRYINKQELKQILAQNKENNCGVEKNERVDNIKFTPLKVNDLNHFSFADIAFIEITRACNLRCKHCLNSSGNALDNQLTTEEIYSLINNLAKSGIQEIRFTGGEPLVNKDIYEMIKFATKLGIYVSIGTNGTLIGKQVAKKLKDAGLKKAVLSLDGTQEKHDSIRGKDQFKKTVRAIKYLQEEKINIKVNSVIMRSNIDDVIMLAKELNKLKIDMFIRRFIASGRGEKLENETLSIDDYNYVREKLNNEIERDPYIRGHYIRLNDEAKDIKIDLPFKIKNGCKAGQRALVIIPNGEIHLCGFLAAQNFPSIGNVREIKNWNKFWNNLQKENILKVLETNLDRYNKIPHVQPTNCLAYVQRMLNMENEKVN